MLKQVNLNFIKKVLITSGENWKYSTFFGEWLSLLNESSKIYCYDLQDAYIFYEIHNPSHGVAIYRGDKWLHSFNPEKRFFLEVNSPTHSSGEWQIMQINKMVRSGEAKSNVPKYTLPFDDVTGWQELLKTNSPQFLSSNFLNACESAVRTGTYICERVNGKITQLIFYYLRENNYEGLYWWSEPNFSLKGFTYIFKLHQMLELKGVLNFSAYCINENISANKLHHLLGYKKVSEYFILTFE